jgi:hypothetical protein
MALAAAVFALAVMGGLVAANFVAGLVEQQSGRNTLYVTQAAEAAEAEIRQVIVDLPPSTLSSLLPGATTSLGAVSSPGMSVERSAVRLTERLFLIRARANRLDADETPLATRALGILVRLSADSAGGSAVVPLIPRPWVQLY